LVDATDQNGYPLTTDYLDVVLTVWPPAPPAPPPPAGAPPFKFKLADATERSAASSGSGSSAKKRLFYEQYYDNDVQFELAYQLIFGTGQSLNQETIQTMIDAVFSAMSLFRNPQHGGNFGGEFTLQGTNDWSVLTNDLANAGVHDFFYFGHGWDSGIGYTNAGLNLTPSALQSVLGNHVAGFINRHSYRFVFLDGCLTGNGDFPQAFGMTKNPLPLVYYQFNNQRLRAMLCWSDKKLIGLIGGVNSYHISFITDFFQNWAGMGPNDPRPITIQKAVDNATTSPSGAVNPVGYGINVFGSKDLLMLK
jgi:hypothetical protein